MPDTVDSSSGGDVQHAGDASARVTTGDAVAAPEAPATRSRWTPQRIAYTVVLVVVVVFLITKAADDLRQFVIVTLNGSREVTVIAGGGAGSQTDFVIDVTGYFL